MSKRFLDKEVYRFKWGNDGRGTPVTMGFALMGGVLLLMVVFGVIPSL